ncbi:MAG: patatin-like phospholipase family protein [Gemmatimonadota bacterium]
MISLRGVAGATARAAIAVLLAAVPAAGQHVLVLSGGGARALSHAGAVVALEQLGYDPPLVVGTSMGAIIGALYAAGYSPDETYRTILEENWLVRFAAEPVLVGQQRMPLRPVLSFGLSRGRFYEGFIPTTGVNLRLVELLFDAGARARNDFDRLPRRYRAVAADLATGAEVVLSGGDLPRAVRASMAVPGAFAPIEWDGRVLVDGGIANNLPVSVARALTDAPVIAIDVLRPSTEIEERRPLDLGTRAVRLLIENAAPDVAAPEILVLPSLATGFSEARFPHDPTSILRGGYDAVIAQVPAAAPAYAPAGRPPGPAPREIIGLRVESTNAALARLVRRTMQASVGAYDAAAVVQRTAALYGTGLFSAVWPRLEYEEGEDDEATLVVAVTPIAGTIVAAAARWDNDVGAGAWLSLRQQLPLASPVDLQVGMLIDELRHRASIEVAAFSQLLPGAVWSAGGHQSDERIRSFQDDTISGEERVRRAGGWAGAELRGPIRDWFISVLARADHVRLPDGRSGWTAGPFVRLATPSRPDRIVGTDPLIEWESRGGIRYDRVRLRTGAGHEFGRVSTAAFLDAHAASSGAPDDVLPSADPELLMWRPTGAVRAPFVAGAGLDLAYPFLLDGYARLRLRAVAAGSKGGELGERRSWRAGGEVGAIWPTVAGPLTLGIAVGAPLDGSIDWRFNLAVGRAF